MINTTNLKAKNQLVKLWEKMNRLPFGAKLFSLFLGWYAPYSGSIGARVEALGVGEVRVSLRDRRKVRNHLKSVHAIASINLGEIVTGLAVLTAITDDMRGIVLGLRSEYKKKARGKLTATAFFELPEPIEDNTPFEVSCEIKDKTGDVVATVTANWLLGYKKQNG
ncbi:MAG: acyl-coenzyme A thioesterase PaaI-like protein [Gammaproteobacteria bacterium]|jgi:acyl-coenzyme A thioesterase PaaI-like protein